MKSCHFLVIIAIAALANGQSNTLTCNEENNFKIIQFTDCHFGEAASKDEQSIASFNDLIHYESPDLIVLSGDFVSGYAYNGTKGWFKDTFDYAITPILASNISWSYTLGNHDDQADWNRTEIISYAASLPQSETYVGPTNIGGVSNYVLTLQNSKSSPVMNIWFMDSLDSNCYDIEGWGCVEFTAVEWYQNQSIALKQKFGKTVSGIMYIHIPLPELLEAYNDFETMGTLEDSGICCWSLNTGLFSVMKEQQDIVATYHGHDHDNDFHGIYHGIDIGYGRKTGFGGYGPPANLSRGARVIEIDCDTGNYTTHIRENNGSVVMDQPKQKAAGWKTWTECCGSNGITNRNLLNDTEWKQLLNK